MAKQLTIRGVPTEVAESLRYLSARRGESVNSTVLRILKGALGVEGRRRYLERYATWTEQDADDFERALRAQRKVDESDWT